MGAITIPMGLIDIFMEIGVVIVMILGSIFLTMEILQPLILYLPLFYRLLLLHL